MSRKHDWRFHKYLPAVLGRKAVLWRRCGNCGQVQERRDLDDAAQRLFNAYCEIPEEEREEDK